MSEHPILGEVADSLLQRRWWPQITRAFAFQWHEARARSAAGTVQEAAAPGLQDGAGQGESAQQHKD